MPEMEEGPPSTTVRQHFQLYSFVPTDLCFRLVPYPALANLLPYHNHHADRGQSIDNGTSLLIVFICPY